ncbi:MAG: AroM family protein [Bacillota bacterium]
MKKGVVGVLTIGQSPRTDVTPSIQNILGPNVAIKEGGGLDRFTDETLHLIFPEETDTIYISRLNNGKSVKIGKSKLLPYLQEELAILEEEVDVMIMLCTGDFQTIKAKKPILYPDKILNHMMKAILPSGTLGLIIPLEEQRQALVKKWIHPEWRIVTEVASPYEKSDIRGAARSLKLQGADVIVLDCMGYGEFHKQEAVEEFGYPVILPRTLVARIVAEYV